MSWNPAFWATACDAAAVNTVAVTLMPRALQIGMLWNKTSIKIKLSVKLNN